MICSLNEIGGLIRKASVGAGYATGLAQNIASAGVWLCNLGIDGLGAVLDAITKQDASIGGCGPTPFELLAASDAEQVVIDAPRSALLVLGMAGVTARATGSHFALALDTGQVIYVGAHDVSPNPLPDLAATMRIVITCTDTIVETVPAVRHGVEIDESAWADLQLFAHRTYVPATAESRLQGAGAGLTDND